MKMVGRKSTAKKIIEELPEVDSYEKTFLVLYDFLDKKASTRFYQNMHRVTELTEDGSSLVQYSCYKTTSLKAALAVHALATREGAEVQIYTVEETTAEKILEQLKAAQA